jgi:hypothetical protein
MLRGRIRTRKNLQVLKKMQLLCNNYFFKRQNPNRSPKNNFKILYFINAKRRREQQIRIIGIFLVYYLDAKEMCNCLKNTQSITKSGDSTIDTF